MANRIKLKRSSVSGNAPTTGDIEVGEVALNMADQVIHYRDASDNIKGIVHDSASNLATEGNFTMDTAGTFDVKNATAFNVTAEHHNGFGIGALPNLTRKRRGNLGTLKSAMSFKLEETDNSGVMINATSGAGPDMAYFVNDGEIGNLAIAAKTAASLGDNTLDVANSAAEFQVYLRAPSQKTVFGVSHQNAQLFNSDLQFDTDDTDQTITPAGTLSVEDNQFITNGGLTANGDAYGTAARFVRTAAGAALIAKRTTTDDLATISGNDGALMAWETVASDGTAFPGYVGMTYNANSSANYFFAKSYDDGVSTFTERNLIIAKKSQFKVMENRVTLSTDGTNESMATTGRLDINVDGGDTTLRIGGGTGVDLLTLNGVNTGNPFYIQTINNDGFRLQSPDGSDFLLVKDDEVKIALNDSPVITVTDNKVEFSQPIQLENLSGDPTGATGLIYFNTTTSKFRGYNGTAWVDLG